MNPAPKIGDVFRIQNRQMFTYGMVKKVNRVNLVYEAVYRVGNVREVQTLKLPLYHWQDAKIVRDGKLIYASPSETPVHKSK